MGWAPGPRTRAGRWSPTIRTRTCQNLYAGCTWAHREGAHRSQVAMVIDSQRRGGVHVLLMSDAMK